MKSTPPKIYNYSGVTGEFTGESFADPDPMDLGNWLIPANACLDKPSPASKGHCVRRVESGWESVEDNRGAIYSTETGDPSMLEDIGPVPAGFTSKAPPSKNHTWNGSSWRLSKELEIAIQKKDAAGKRADLQLQASVRIAPLQDASDLGDASDSEKSDLLAWKKYRLALNRIELQEGFPSDVVWPKSPEEES